MRLTSLDVFRGIAITSMILVNNPGSWSYVYAPLLHAEWHGFTPTDWVFPSFLFIVGVAIAFSLPKYTKDDKPTAQAYWRITRRSAILFALGLLLNGSSIVLDWLLNGASLSDLANIRIMGVLQRIALTYLLAALAVLNFPRRFLWVLMAVILLGYWGAMSLVPVPGYGAGNLTPGGNLAAYCDRLILGTNHLYKQGQFDPEGLFSTLPAVATVLAGYFTGDWLRHQPIKSRTSLGLALFGIGCLGLGWAWGLMFPINKQLWTSSYVIFSTGWDLLLLAVCYQLIEVRGIRKWGFPFQVMGLNAIFVFVASGFLIRILSRIHVGTGDNAPSVYTWIYKNLFAPWAGVMNGSLIFALVNVLFWWVILYGMYRKHWFLKI
ncbi:MAG: heparan-alpha-glucosaminide N-acetyltransferase domain-containing protein [Coleofasciculus sp. S288]|nr:heparan-alpha-glucosaminide N-acetyltransferase domain-containing protein [Coleofasciculus sp. S288]